tara:strand:- start:1142 stop:1414 length:273 start_codon:yes stop_codon:yes gene_type:complete
VVGFSGSEVGNIKQFIHGRFVNDRLRYQREGTEYLLMTHYNMGLKEVRGLSVDDAKQLMHWAQAMHGEEKLPDNAVYLGYDVVPPVEEIA